MIEALITSIGEPQLPRCLESVGSQTVPFGAVTHISGVTPALKAFKEGLDKVTQEWFMWIGGDMVLYPNAVETAVSAMERNNGNIWKYLFGVHDTFMRRVMKSCTVMKTDVARLYSWPDRLRFDSYSEVYMRRRGWRVCRVTTSGDTLHWDVISKNMVPIATHFDNPDAFQIFNRFSRPGFRKHDMGQIKYIYKRTRDPKIAFAIACWEFGLKHDYPIEKESINLNFYVKMYEEFLKTDEGKHHYSRIQQS